VLNCMRDRTDFCEELFVTFAAQCKAARLSALAWRRASFRRESPCGESASSRAVKYLRGADTELKRQCTFLSPAQKPLTLRNGSGFKLSLSANFHSRSSGECEVWTLTMKR